MQKRVNRECDRASWQAAAAVFLSMMVLVATGCTGLEPAMIGAASSGLQTGASATKWGKVNVVFHASKTRVNEAVRTVTEELGLTMAKTKVNDNGRRTQYILKNDSGDKYEVTVRSLAARMVALKVNVGWFGSSPAANLLVKRIRSVLFEEAGGSDSLDGSSSL